MNILIVGNSGCENALICKLAQSDLCDKIFCAPGNTAYAPYAEAVGIELSDIDALCDFATEHMIGLTLVSDESALALGITERFESEGLKIFAPSKVAIDFIRDKDNAVLFLQKYISAYVREDPDKNDNIGLQCLCDGQRILPLAAYKLYRKLFDNDEGEKTDGMGAYSPVSSINHKMLSEISQNITTPLQEALISEGIVYKGIINLRLVCSEDGIKICGFGSYMGAPETGLLTLRLHNDLVKLLLSATDSSLSDDEIKWNGMSAVCCAVVSGGYPDEYKTGFVITLPQTEEDVYIFYGDVSAAGGELLTDGGRVLYVCATAHTNDAARAKVYETVSQINFSGMYYRSDIARMVL